MNGSLRDSRSLFWKESVHNLLKYFSGFISTVSPQFHQKPTMPNLRSCGRTLQLFIFGYLQISSNSLASHAVGPRSESWFLQMTLFLLPCSWQLGNLKIGDFRGTLFSIFLLHWKIILFLNPIIGSILDGFYNVFFCCWIRTKLSSLDSCTCCPTSHTA